MSAVAVVAEWTRQPFDLPMLVPQSPVMSLDDLDSELNFMMSSPKGIVMTTSASLCADCAGSGGNSAGTCGCATTYLSHTHCCV